MSDMTDMAATPIPWSIGGREFAFARLRSAEVGQFEQWAKGRRLAEISAIGATEDELRELRKEFFRDVFYGNKAVNWNTELTSMEGVVQVLYLSAHKADPTVQRQELADLIGWDNFGDVVEVALAIAFGGPMPEKEKKETTGDSPSTEVGESTDPPGECWTALAVQLCEAYHWTFEEVGQLTLYQIHALAMGHEKVKAQYDFRTLTPHQRERREDIRRQAQALGIHIEE